MRLLFALAALGSASVALAQETFQYVGPSGAQSWTTPTNWDGGSGAFSGWPGEAPEAGTRDSATVIGDWPGGLQLDIDQPVAVEVLRFGASGFAETVIGGQGSLTADRIEPAGSVFATNRIGVDLLLDESLDFANATTSITLDGRLVNGAPSGSQRTVENATDRTLTINGAVLLSDTPGAAGDLRFVNGGASETVLAGVISDGSAPGGQVTFAKGLFNHLVENTYTGRTQIGSNDPNVESEHVIHTDSPFGTGRLVVSGGNAAKVIRAAVGKGTRTLANDLQIARSVEFTGVETIVLDGTVWQSNGRSLINNIGGAGRLVINGDVYASDTDDVREWTFDGPGLTVVNGVIDDSLTVPGLTGASVTQRGTGVLVFTNPAVAAYTGPTRVDSELRLGDGGAAVGLNGDVVTGDGALVFNHSGELSFDTRIEGGLGVRHVGAGATRLGRANSNTGSFEVVAGELIVNGEAGDVSVTGGVGGVDGLLGGGGAVGAIDIGPAGRLAPGDGVGELAAATLQVHSTGEFIAEVESADSDHLAVAGAAVLDGELMIELPGGWPDPAAEYTVLTANSVSGMFANAADAARLATAERTGSFEVAYDGSTVSLSAFALAGDYNNDGSVDAADYTVWRDAVGQPPASLPNDIDGGEAVGLAQYETWRANFGASLAAPGAAVPEAGAGLLLLSAFPLLVMARCRQAA